MINSNRVVSVTRTDLLSLYATMLVGDQVSSLAKVSASEPGVFVVSSGSGNKIADEPVKSFDFASGVSSMTLYFVPAFDFEGFKVQGTAVTTSGADVDADSATLYTATLSGGAVTIAKIGL